MLPGVTKALCRAGVLLLAALAPTSAAVAVGAETGLPTPRFVSLRSSEANLRAGPGFRFPVEWVYTRRHMPLEIVDEYENWRKVRDWQGTEGWMHKSMLTGRRTAILTGEKDAPRTLRRQASINAPATVRAEPGAIGALLECDGRWCRLDVGGYKGWLPRSQFWGAYPGENID